MEKKSDRRALDRRTVAGANVTYRKSNRMGLLERYSRPFPVRDLTKSGICFESDKSVRFGEKLRVEIHIPGEKEIKLEGEVRWFGNLGADHRVFVGAQFRPFGKGRRYNSMQSLEMLRKVCDTSAN